MDESFSTALKEARKARGWTQEDLATQLGVSQQSVQKWETGASLPRPQRREALMHALGIDYAHRMRDLEQRTSLFHAEESRYAERYYPPAPQPTRLSGQVRENAFMAAVEQALPPELHDCLEPPHTAGFRFAADYLSPRIAMEFVRVSGPVSSLSQTSILRKLWGLSTLRKINEHASNSPRHYVLVLVGEDLHRLYIDASRWTFDATLHGIRIEVAENAEAVAALVTDYEKGLRPIETPHYDYDEGDVPPPTEPITG